MGHIATDFDSHLTYQICKNWSKYTVVGSFWTDFDAKLRLKQVKSGLEALKLRKIGLKVTFQRFSVIPIGIHFRPQLRHEISKNCYKNMVD